MLRPRVPKHKGRLHSAHTGSMLPIDFVVKVPLRSCRECHQKTAKHQFVDRQCSRVPRCGLRWSSSQLHSLPCSQRRCGESPRVKFQRLSSEDCRTPVCGHASKQSAEFRSAFFATAQVLFIHIFYSVHPFSCRGHGVGDSRNLGKSMVRLFVSSSSESHVSGCRNDHWCRVLASSS